MVDGQVQRGPREYEDAALQPQDRWPVGARLEITRRFRVLRRCRARHEQAVCWASDGGNFVSRSPFAASSRDWVRKILPVRSAPLRSAPLKSAPMRSAPLRSAPVRGAPVSRCDGSGPAGPPRGRFPRSRSVAPLVGPPARPAGGRTRREAMVCGRTPWRSQGGRPTAVPACRDARWPIGTRTHGPLGVESDPCGPSCAAAGAG
jgi:hypothetical protein